MTGTTPKTLAILLFTLLVAITAQAQNNAPKNLLLNGDFSQSMDEWDVLRGHCATMRVVDATGPVANAVHIIVQPKPGAWPWAAELIQTIDGRLVKGNKVDLALWMRSPDLNRVTVCVEETAMPHGAILKQETKLSAEWKEYRYTGLIFKDFASDEAQLGVHLAHDKGSILIANVRLVTGPTNAPAPGIVNTPPQQAPPVVTQATTPPTPIITDKVKAFLGAKTIASLQGATKGEAYRVDVTASPTGKQKIGNYTVVGAVNEQDQAFATRLADVLFNEKTYMFAGAVPITGRCVLAPNVAYKIWRGDASVTVLVDFKCGETMFISDDSKETALAFKSAVVAQTQADLTNLTIDAFPFHPPIR